MSDDMARKITEAFEDQDLHEIGGVLVGWVMVAEWMDLEGRRWLTRLDANADGENLPEWQRNGYLHNALNTPWPELEVEEDEE